MSLPYTAFSLVVAVVFLAGAAWLLYRIDLAPSGTGSGGKVRLLARRMLLLLCALATGAPRESIWPGFMGDAVGMNLMVLWALSVVLIGVNIRQKTGFRFYVMDLALLWGAWVVGITLIAGRFSWSLIVMIGIMWSVFALLGRGVFFLKRQGRRVTHGRD